MNTHIIIPIKDIEEMIMKLSDTITDDMTKKESDKINIKISTLSEFLVFKRYKQVSLDEKDIEGKAIKLFPIEYQEFECDGHEWNEDTNEDLRIGYKQALKDLI